VGTTITLLRSLSITSPAREIKSSGNTIGNATQLHPLMQVQSINVSKLLEPEASGQLKIVVFKDLHTLQLFGKGLTKLFLPDLL
jgi:hypothetical protein